MILFYDKDGNRLEKTYECGWSFSQKRNKEGTGKIELIDYPENAVYAELYKGTEKMQTVVITEHSRNEKRVSTSVRTLESLFKNYRIPEHWKGWDKKPLSFVLADAIYGFDYIRKTTLEDFTGYLEKHRIALSKIKDGDIHLDYHEVEDGIRYYESGYITFAFDLGDAVSERYVRWEETAGEKVYIGIQSASSDTPITHISQVDFSESPILTINRAVEHDSELTGVPIASNKRYVAVRFILKYINPDWVSDFATHKVYNEHNVLVDRTVRGFTPVLRAFEIITRKKTPFTLRSSPLNMGELVQGVELSNLTVWQAIQKIREKYPFDTRCTFEDGRLYFEFSKSFVQDRKRQYPYLLRAGDKAAEQLNNTNIKELKTNTQKVNVLHCYGEGEKLKKLYVRIPETGTFDSLPAVEEVFTDSKIKTLNELQEGGLKKLKEKRKEDNPIFEVETLQPIRLLDEVSLVHPETNRIYDAVVEEESISYKESKLSQKFGLGGFLFNPIDALIKKEVQEDIRDYAFQPFGLTAYGRHKSILLIWQGKEKEYVIKWKEKGAADYNYRKVAGFESEFTALKDDSVEYVFSVAGVFMDAVSAYTAEITAHTVTIRDGKDGRDGTTKFLASLETPGDYENQIGTFQGLLYRWVKAKWELLNAVMPVNPICAYDFADVQYKDVTQTRLRGFSYKFLAGTSYSQYSKQATDALLNGKRYRITADFEVLQGEAKFATMYYYDFTTPQPWGTALYQSHTPVVNRRCTCVLEFVCKNTDLQGHDLRILFYNGREGAIQPNGISKWSNFKIETIADTQALDLSGNGNHANIAGNVEKRKDNKIGTILKCHNGYLARPAQHYIGVGKKWSHSRWVKIDQNKQDETKTSYLWYYGRFDYGLFAIKDLNGIPPAVWQVTYKNWENQCYTTIAKNTLLDNTWHHLVVMTDLQETYVRKITYLDCQKIGDVRKDGDFSNLASSKLHSEMNLEGDYTIGSLSNLIFFDRMLTEQEVLWLYLNPQYPIKNYSLADWSIDPANPDNVLANATPKYLGVVETVPATRTAIITKGERLGAVDANTGDWVLSGKTIGGWKVGVCYRWTGEKWAALTPEKNFAEHYHACILHICEIEELMKETGHFGALFAKQLIAQEAFIKKLAADQAFLKELIVQRLKIDSDRNSDKDFEAWFDETNGLKINNGGQEILKIDPVTGEALFTGKINAGAVQLIDKGVFIKDGEISVENAGWKGTLRPCSNGVELVIMGGDGGLMQKKQLFTRIAGGVMSLFVLGSITCCEGMFKGNTGAVVNGWENKNGVTHGSLYAVACNNNIWVASGHHYVQDWKLYSAVFISTNNGNTWTKKTFDEKEILIDVAYNGNTWVAVGGGGTILVSTNNGNTWTRKNSGTGTALNGIAHNGNTWVAVGGGTILVSTNNGNTWTKKNSGTGAVLNGIAHNGNTWVAVGYDGTILASSDNGNTWTKKNSGTGAVLNGIALNGNICVAVGSGGTILASSDNGNTWTKKNSGTGEYLNGIALNGNTWVAVGDGGTILASSDTAIWK